MTAEEEARRLDAEDPLPTLRGEFLVPPAPGGRYAEAAYLAGNSLGLQPRSVAGRLREELDDWARLAVEAHTGAAGPGWTTTSCCASPRRASSARCRTRSSP